MSIVGDLKQAKFLGHPIHSMLIHFPIALLSASVVLDALGYLTKELSFAVAAYYMLTGCVWSAAAAAVFGFLDYVKIPGEKARARRTATLHLILNVLWVMAAGVVWGVRAGEYPSLPLEPPALFVTLVIALCVMLISSHLGGDLVLRDGIGRIAQHEDEA